MNLLPLANYLEENNLGTVGTNLFVEQFPAECKTGILLRAPLMGAQIDHELPGYLKFDFRVVVRHTSRGPGYELACRLAKQLNMLKTTIGEWTVNYLRPVNVPSQFPMSVGESVEFNINMEVCLVDDEWALK